MHPTLPPPGPRLPHNYRLVGDVVREHGRGRHLTTADVHALAKQRKPTIGFTTVYRALNRLSELGLVSEVRVPNADTTYYETPGEPHAHFHCDHCGRIDDLDYRLSNAVVQRIARAHGIEVSEALVTLGGRCARCRDAASAG
ncbi:MAG TPA: Fur family transcriptional regulator [Candidatus Elarobacter sp.]